jgi:hypothetical protein
VEAWQSPQALLQFTTDVLLQFAIDVYGLHKSDGLDHNVHVNFRPHIFNEPVAAALQQEQHYHTEIRDDREMGDLSDEMFATSVRPGAKAPYRNQLGYHGTQSGGGNPSTRQQAAPDRFAVGRQR